jgi:hypothetical protein
MGWYNSEDIIIALHETKTAPEERAMKIRLHNDGSMIIMISMINMVQEVHL